MKTLYAKRVRIHKCDIYGIQVSSSRTPLLRVTISGFNRERGFGPSRAQWEWAGNGKVIEGSDLERLLRMYPVCEFQSEDDLMWRIKNARKQGC